MSNQEINLSSAKMVIDDQDLLAEILVRLPIKSILRFKSVSKNCLSLINDPFFSRRLNSGLSTVSGLFLHTSSTNSKLGFISLNNYNEHSRYINFFPGLTNVRILNACNGLLCCHAFIESEKKEQDVILNPTTKQFRVLPQPNLPYVQDMCLAFDPKKSPHYKVVCISYTVYGSDCFYRIEIYSSENGLWKITGEPILREDYIQFHGGVYWNGAINWFSTQEDSFYFHVEKECLGVMPMLPLSNENWYNREFRHFGESGGHLHLVEIYGRTTKFYIYEMERDYSGWVVKYNVDLERVGNAFPEMMQTHPLERRHRVDFESYSFDILSLIRGKREEEDFLVLQLPGKIVLFYLETKIYKIIWDSLWRCENRGIVEFSLMNFWFADYYIESLSGV